MARTATTFIAAFDELCRATKGQPESEITGVQRDNLAGYLNAGYRDAWSYNGTPWEDSWEDGAVDVTAGVVPWSEIDDAHVFNLWSADPRTDTRARWIAASSTSEGLFVGESWNAGLYGFWRPVCPQWDGTSTAATLITLLKPAALAFAQAEYWRNAGQHQTAGGRRKDAKDMLDDLAAIEFERVQHHWWLRRKA